MLLTLDAGNTNTVIGLYADKASTKAGAVKASSSIGGCRQKPNAPPTNTPC